MKHILVSLLLLSVTHTLPAALQPLGELNDGAVRTALDFQGIHYRNSGHHLERWDLGQDPPLFVDRVLLESPPVDLMEWDGRLLILRDDGVLEFRLPGESWNTVHWSLELSEFATELIRRGRWLLPVSPLMPLLDLIDPDSPVVAQDEIHPDGGEFYSIGNEHACFLGDTLVGNFIDGCNISPWIELGEFGMAFDDNGPGGPSFSIGEDGERMSSDVVAVRGALACAGPGSVELLDGVTFSRLAQVSMGPFGYGIRLAARDSLLLASTLDQLRIYIVHPDQAPYLELLSEYYVPGGQDLRVQGDTVLVAGSSSTTWISIADPAAPFLIRGLSTQGRVCGVAKVNDHLLVRRRDLHVLRVEDGGLVESSTLELPPGEGLVGEGNLAIAATPDSLLVLDLSDPFQPVIRAALATPGRRSFCLDGIVLAHDTGTEVVIHSLENPALPVERLRLETSAEMLQADGGIVAWLENDTAIRMLDVRNPAAPVLAGSLAWTNGCRQFAFCNQRLLLNQWVADQPFPDAHLHVYSLDDPNQPTLLNTRIHSDVEETLHGGADRFTVDVELPVYLQGSVYLQFVHPDGSVTISALWGNSWAGYVAPTVLGMFADAWVVFQDSDGRLRLVFDDTFLAVEPETDIVPSGFDLQAFPNPFNPTTRVSFVLQHRGRVTLNLFNLRGERVRALLDETLDARQHESLLDGSGLATGMYFLRLETREGGQTRKVLLLK